MTTQTPTAHHIIRSIAWTLPSASRPGVKHTVSEDIETGARSCNCEASDHAKTRGRCWHLRAVASGLAGRPTVRVTQRTPLRGRTSVAGAAYAAALEV